MRAGERIRDGIVARGAGECKGGAELGRGPQERLLIVVWASQIRLNRWGLPVLVNLLWGESGGRSDAKKPPPKRPVRVDSPPPYSHIELSARCINQKLSRASGVQGRERKERKPSLKDVRLEDLMNPARLDALYAEAKTTGIVSGSSAARLQWFAAAEHAMAVASSNPGGLFVSLCRRGLWEYITHQEEDTARAKLKKLDYREESRLLTIGQVT